MMNEEYSKLDYTELLNHIKQYHPSKYSSKSRDKNQDKNTSDYDAKEVSFGICENLGSLAFFKWCCGLDDTTEMAKQIGIGASLFLMSTKVFAIFFFILFLINIPVMIFYAGGVDHGEQAERSMFDYFSIMSLGNVGSPGYTCGEQNLAKFNIGQKNSMFMELSCGFGTLGPLIDVGLSKDNKNSCKKLLR